MQVRRLYDRAGHRTTHSIWCCSASAADARRDRALPSCLQAKQPADVEQARGNRLSDSQPNAIALHLGFPIHKGALFLFLHVKVGFVITKTLLATEREQPKAASTKKGSPCTKKQQFDRKIQAFAGYFQVNTGRVQPLQMPVISLILYCKRLTLYCKCLILTLTTISYFLAFLTKSELI